MNSDTLGGACKQFVGKARESGDNSPLTTSKPSEAKKIR